MKTFKLPTLDEFKSLDKKIDPYLKFYRWIGQQLDSEWTPGGEIKLDPSKICLAREDEKYLFQLELKWAKKHGISEKQMAWHNLGYGPSVIDKKPGFVYVKARAFTKEK